MIGRKMLFVEDKKINQLVMSKMLKTLNVSFTLAENGEVALGKLKAEDFDMVFMDCQMPVMDELEASRRIRTSEKT
jgi:CheY-like chemotaxis protein